jgi:TRAP-type C4-dicarboxylate transport system substrate-binding protein
MVLSRRDLLVSASAAAATIGAGSTAARAATGADAHIVLRLGGALADDHPESRSFFWLAQRMKEKTNGQLEIQVFNNAQLGQERDMAEGVQLGTVDMAKTMSSVLTGFVPELR